MKTIIFDESKFSIGIDMLAEAGRKESPRTVQIAMDVLKGAIVAQQEAPAPESENDQRTREQ